MTSPLFEGFNLVVRLIFAVTIAILLWEDGHELVAVLAGFAWTTASVQVWARQPETRR